MIGTTNSIEQKEKLNIDNNTLLLITDTLEDKSSYHHEITNHGVTISTSRQRDGRNSLSFSNTTMELPATDPGLITMLGNNDWTVEFWAYVTTWNTNASVLFTLGTRSGDAVPFMFGYHATKTWYASNNGGSWNVIGGTVAFNTLITNAWAHYAVVMKYPSLTCYLNGVKQVNLNLGTVSMSGQLMGVIRFGNYGYSQTSVSHTMNLQDIRFSNIARYLTDFTPPDRLV